MYPRVLMPITHNEVVSMEHSCRIFVYFSIGQRQMHFCTTASWEKSTLTAEAITTALLSCIVNLPLKTHKQLHLANTVSLDEAQEWRCKWIHITIERCPEILKHPMEVASAKFFFT